MTTAMNATAERIGGPETRSAVTAELLDVSQVADLLGCSVRHVRRLADGGRMPAPVKLGSLVRWRRRGGPTDSIEGWIGNGCKPVGRGGGR